MGQALSKRVPSISDSPLQEDYAERSHSPSIWSAPVTPIRTDLQATTTSWSPAATASSSLLASPTMLTTPRSPTSPISPTILTTANTPTSPNTPTTPLTPITPTSAESDITCPAPARKLTRISELIDPRDLLIYHPALRERKMTNPNPASGSTSNQDTPAPEPNPPKLTINTSLSGDTELEPDEYMRHPNRPLAMWERREMILQRTREGIERLEAESRAANRSRLGFRMGVDDSGVRGNGGGGAKRKWWCCGWWPFK